MARARTIKPGFFTNADLVECEPLARLLFAGLWCEADRRGILEDRPKTLKIKILPGDNCDVDGLLIDLEQAGFIRRYTEDGQRCILILNFGKHQNPHRDEKASMLPAPCQHSANTVLTPDQSGLLPITDSLLPITQQVEDANAPKNPKRATAISEDFTVTDEMRSWAEGKGFAANVIAEQTDRFKDHFIGNGKPMKDWPAAWRNWMRNSPAFAGGRNNGSPPIARTAEEIDSAMAAARKEMGHPGRGSFVTGPLAKVPTPITAKNGEPF